ncbi:S-protein homolog 18-like [Tripterygium wilfordii]|uniref:S-protein homolog 18-like n=1 Tax=Tripterygium wilfordii TaxID=458696 RepID=UPI0018F7E778|nr:S-protein homolog 18-like [Tripterygium wilfordii]
MCNAWSLNPPQKEFVNVTNDLGPGIDLSLHCKSGNDDLGKHILKYHGDGYGFHFCSNVWGTTQFYCKFWDTKSCAYGGKFCNWVVRPSGPCLTTNILILCYQWNSDPY